MKKKQKKKNTKYKIFSKEKQRKTNLNIWNTGTNGGQDPSDEADESHHCLSPQHCGMDSDGGNCRKEPFWLHDGSLSLTLTFVFYCLHVWRMDSY